MEEKIKILLIEDNPGDARLLDVYLRESFDDVFTLLTADYLSKGIKVLEKEHFDIIIVDLSLPDSNGLNSFIKIHEHAPETPIIVLTGLDDESIGINAMKHGAQDFLVKGKLRSRSLKRAINYSIERAKLLNELAEKTRNLEEKTEALNKEKLKLAQAQKLSHIGSWELDLATKKLIWSEELYRIYGMEPGTEVEYDELIHTTHVADREYVKNVVSETIHTHKPFHFYYRIIRADNSIRTLDARGEVVTDDQGNAVSMAGTLQDVTERIQEEEMEKLATAATKSYNSVIIANKDGLIEWVNEGFTKLTGYTLDEVKGTHGEKLKGENEDTGLSKKSDFYESVIKEKKPVIYESKNFSKEGKEYWVITTLTPVLNKEGEVERILAIESDITLRKKIEEELVLANKIAEHSLIKGNKALDELMKAKKQLEESMRVKEQFIANMSHEIRTPMNAIVGFTDLLLKTKLTAEQKQYIDSVKTAGENLIVIINDVLDFSKIQSGKVSFETINFRLSQIMSMVTELMLPKSMEKNINLSTVIDKNIPDRLTGDPTRLNQILLNLVGNSIKFTKKGEIKTTVSLLSESANEVELQFSVKDTGIGIPKENLTSIFEEFRQATNDTTRKYGGSGLGLTIVKQLVEMQGGKIWVESEVGVGSTFSFVLKFRKNLNHAVGKESKPQEIKSEPIEGLDVLLVEDNILNQVLAKKVLTNWKWNVEVAENGLIALEKLKEKDFDIILMDIQLPEMDGYDATRHIRNDFTSPKRETPIMAMTAHAMAGEEEKCRAAGMDGYISKPFDQKVLYSRIINILNEHRKLSNDIKSDNRKINNTKS